MKTKQLDHLAINDRAVKLCQEMLEIHDLLKIAVIKSPLGPTIIDMGVKTRGSFLAGKFATLISMGGLAKIAFDCLTIDKYTLPSISVSTDYPVQATLGSQLAGWNITKNGYTAMVSGPGRILAKKPRKMLEKLNISEESEKTVFILETSTLPPPSILKYLAKKCAVPLEGLYLLVIPTASLAGVVQIAGRSVETALHQLYNLGMDVTTIISGLGITPISPYKSGDFLTMMGRTNDLLIYGSEVLLQLDYPNDTELQELLSNAISKSSDTYGSLFHELFKKAKGDFYKLDPKLFAPAKLTINNVSSGKIFSKGERNDKLIVKSIERSI
ncbi:MAG: methenyltetrahydromethanopterin cyclohydrolase [Asgard group archaeon]|nr:methenyltetrahydromethanopterin cyclohydrolase [Asgard group archaeon]